MPYMEYVSDVNDSYGPPTPDMECGNLVTVNDFYGRPIPYMEYVSDVNDSYGPPIPYMNVGTL